MVIDHVMRLMMMSVYYLIELDELRQCILANYDEVSWSPVSIIMCDPVAARCSC